MEFILMVVVFAAVFLFLPRILNVPASSEHDVSHSEAPSLKEAVSSERPYNEKQTTSDSLEKQ
jgi:hypothetical protein